MMVFFILLWVFAGYVSACMWKTSSMKLFQLYDGSDVTMSIVMTIGGIISLFGYVFAVSIEPLLTFNISTWNPYKTE